MPQTRSDTDTAQLTKNQSTKVLADGGMSACVCRGVGF